MKSTAIVQSARRTLRDNFPQSETQTDDDFVDYINRAVKAIVNVDATASVKTGEIPLVEGSIQSIPSDGGRILKILANALDSTAWARINGRKYLGTSSVKNLPLSTLQAQIPNWAGGKKTDIVTYITFNEDDPTSFITYPPNTGAGILTGTYSVIPPDITEIPAVAEEDIALPYSYFNALVNITIANCLARDSENKDIMARSQAFMQSGLAEIGFKGEKDSTETPQNTVRS